MNPSCLLQVIGASQKGLSTPPGLSVTALSVAALKRLEERKSLVSSYFASYKRWLPIMQSYEAGTPGYFATPPVVSLPASSSLLSAPPPDHLRFIELDLRP